MQDKVKEREKTWLCQHTLISLRQSLHPSKPVLLAQTTVSKTSLSYELLYTHLSLCPPPPLTPTLGKGKGPRPTPLFNVLAFLQSFN